MLEDYLVSYCAPTLAGLKSGSLFSCNCENRVQLMLEVQQLNRKLSSKGLRLIPLSFSKQKTLVLLFRPKVLASELETPAAKRILQKEGYQDFTLYTALGHLIKKIRESETFPHEIGLFLGYPPGDVEGFIENQGRNSLLTGMWKVYKDVDSAIKIFRKFKKCTDVYCRSYRMGNQLERLAVAER